VGGRWEFDPPGIQDALGKLDAIGHAYSKVAIRHDDNARVVVGVPPGVRNRVPNGIEQTNRLCADRRRIDRRPELEIDGSIERSSPSNAPHENRGGGVLNTMKLAESGGGPLAVTTAVRGPTAAAESISSCTVTVVGLVTVTDAVLTPSPNEA
jgi:hypothetical protein